jgi:hypothetical protein
MPHVSSYDDVFKNAYDKGVKEMPAELPELVKKIVDNFHEDVLTRLHYYIVDEMKPNIDRDICDHAAKVAESMISNALAGDDATIRNLFGFNEWYMTHLYAGKLPTQWALIDAIAKRNPDLFVNEKIAQQAAEIAELNNVIARQKDTIEYFRRGQL